MKQPEQLKKYEGIKKKPENNPIVKWMANPTNRKLAINAKCAECVGCEAHHIEHGFRETIRNCTAIKCPLYHVRPFK